MFMAADEPVFWSASKNQVRCYCHKLALTVKDALALIKVNSGPTKPTKPTGRSLHLLLPKNPIPTPDLILSDAQAALETGQSDWEDVEEGEEDDNEADSDCEADETEPNPTPDDFDSDNEASGDEEEDEPYTEAQVSGPILSRSLIKVRSHTSHLSSFDHMD